MFFFLIFVYLFILNVSIYVSIIITIYTLGYNPLKNISFEISEYSLNY